ncbi:MAG: hypothetical protein FWG80_00965 [Alphaproteobacteria bacterium]|nr:hypothetical protein [Alphaproteobacteria bacterium]
MYNNNVDYELHDPMTQYYIDQERLTSEELEAAKAARTLRSFVSYLTKPHNVKNWSKLGEQCGVYIDKLDDAKVEPKRIDDKYIRLLEADAWRLYNINSRQYAHSLC